MEDIALKITFGNPSQYIARMAFAYKLEPHHMQFAVGVAHLGFYAGDSLNRVEWRPYVGLVINNKYPGFKLQHRARIEYRSFKTLGTGDMSWNIRYRYRMFMNIPLLKLSSENKSMALSWNMGDEIFINGGSNVVYNLFNQNRLLLGPALQVNKSLTLSLTYTAEYGSRNSPANYRYSNIIWLGIKHKLDFTQKSKVEDDGSGTGSGKGNGGGKGSGNGSGDEKGVSKEKSK